MAGQESTEGNVLTDLMRLGPAPTMARELVTLVINLALLGVLYLVISDSSPGVALVVVAVVGGFLAIRFLIGMAIWKQEA